MPSDPHNDRCASLLGQGCDCRSPWATDTAGSPCPQGRTDYEACFAPFRYCPVKGCGRAEGERQLPTEATPGGFEAGRRAATADIVAALRRQIQHHDPDASIATVIWRDAAHLAQRVGDGHRD